MSQHRRQRWTHAARREGDRVRAAIGDTNRVGTIVGIRNPKARYVQYLVFWDPQSLTVKTDPTRSWMAEDDVKEVK